MPTYGYGCRKCNAEFEVVQKITDEPLKVHEGCGGELRRLLYPVGIVFKGPGFYVNDYGRAGKNGSNGTGSKDSTSGNGSGSKTESKPEPKAETKAEAPATKAD